MVKCLLHTFWEIVSLLDELILFLYLNSDV